MKRMNQEKEREWWAIKLSLIDAVVDGRKTHWAILREPSPNINRPQPLFVTTLWPF